MEEPCDTQEVYSRDSRERRGHVFQYTSKPAKRTRGCSCGEELKVIEEVNKKNAVEDNGVSEESNI